MSPSARRYAEDTNVPVERSRQQLEALLKTHGAEGYATGWDAHQDRIEFLLKGLQIRFVLPRTPSQQRTARLREQAERQRWRALQLVVRAKLEAIASGIAVFEQEFLGFVVNPLTNRTIYEHAQPALKGKQWDVSRLLPAAGETGA